MKQDTSFFSANAKILQHETPLDIIKEITQQPGWEDPFYVLDVGDIVRKVKLWKLKMPRVHPFYAVKCNDNKTVLHTLAALGTGFDCASKAEMQKVLDMDIDPSRIIYAHPCKPVSHIRQAARLNVPLMTFDNEPELHKIKNIFPTAQLVIRIRCDASKAQCPLGIKFGVLPSDAESLLVVAQKLGLNVVGVSFHVGSGCQEPPVFHRAISAARMVFNQAVDLGFNPNLLDIGGGFPGTTNDSLDELALVINDALEEFFPEQCGVKVIAEPGRYLVASAFTLSTSVVSKREVCDDNGGLLSTMYYINDGVYGSFNCTLYDHQVVYPKLLKETVEEELPCSVWGPTCDGLDQVVNSASLPRLELGDWLVWDNMGAYTLAAANTFNGFPIPSVFVVVPYHTWLFLEEYLGSVLLDGEEEANCKDLIEEKSMALSLPPLVPCGANWDTSTNEELVAKLKMVDIAEM